MAPPCGCSTQVALAAWAGEPVLLRGPTSCKSTAVHKFLRLCGRLKTLVTEHLTQGEPHPAPWVLTRHSASQPASHEYLPASSALWE